MKPFLCKIGIHFYKRLAVDPQWPTHGFTVLDADHTDEGGWDDSLYLHAKRCSRCGKISAFICDQYWYENRNKGSHHSEPSEEELLEFLEVHFKNKNKDDENKRPPTQNELLEFLYADKKY